jgi:hypothetical protein
MALPRVECVRDPLIGEFTVGQYYDLSVVELSLVVHDDNGQSHTFTAHELDYYFD